MDKQFSRLVQFVWRFRDLSRWKIPGLGIAYPFKQILAVQFDYDGRTMLNRQFIQKDRRIFKLYNTNSLVRAFPRLESVKSVRTLSKVERKPIKMIRFLIPLGIVVGAICAFALYRNFTAKPEASHETKQPSVTQSATPSSATAVNSRGKQRDKDKDLYDIFSESFQAWNGIDRALKTAEGGWYQVGEMSARGYVTAVSERRAKVFQPDGREGWVIAVTDARRLLPDAAGASAPIASPSPSGEIIIAPDTTGHNLGVNTAPAEPAKSGTPFPIVKTR